MSNSDRLVWLQHGYVAPRAAYDLVCRCTKLGILLSIRGRLGSEVLSADGPLTPEIVAELKQLKPHVLLLLRHTPSDLHVKDDTAPRPELGPVVVSKVERNRGL